MKSRMMFAAGVVGSLGALVSSPAFAQETEGSSMGAASKMRAQAQFELLPVGSAKTTVMNESSDPQDAALAYGITAAFDYAVTPYLSIGVAPRVVFNVAAAEPMNEPGEQEDKGTEYDLRARISGHYPIARGLEVNASVMPGYTFVTSSIEGAPTAKGFALGGAVGLTYDITPRMFVGAEVGYQRAFLSSELDLGTTKLDLDADLSYMHVGLGAGTRF